MGAPRRAQAAPAVERVHQSLQRQGFQRLDDRRPRRIFTIQDGAIVAKGAAKIFTGGIRNHSFRNFELKIDVMTALDRTASAC